MLFSLGWDKYRDAQQDCADSANRVVEGQLQMLPMRFSEELQANCMRKKDQIS